MERPLALGLIVPALNVAVDNAGERGHRTPVRPDQGALSPEGARTAMANALRQIILRLQEHQAPSGRSEPHQRTRAERVGAVFTWEADFFGDQRPARRRGRPLAWGAGDFLEADSGTRLQAGSFGRILYNREGHCLGQKHALDGLLGRLRAWLRWPIHLGADQPFLRGDGDGDPLD